MVLREISKTTDASVILPVFSQYARTFLRKSNEYAISILYHKCTIFISFYYIKLYTQLIDLYTHNKHADLEYRELPPQEKNTLINLFNSFDSIYRFKED